MWYTRVLHIATGIPSVPLASRWSLGLVADLPFRGSKVTLLTAALALGPVRECGTATSALVAEHQPTEPAVVPDGE